MDEASEVFAARIDRAEGQIAELLQGRLTAFDASAVLVGMGIGIKAGSSITLTKSGPFIVISASTVAAPSNVDYLVGTADATLTNEIVVGPTPGGELGGTWASPTVDATHSGSTHSAAADTHIADTTSAHAHGSIGVTGMKQSVILKGWRPTTTAGCAEVAKTELGTTTKHDEYTLAFDSATAESAFLSFPMPDNWDGGTVTFYVWWFAKTGWVTGTSDGVAWTIKGTCYESAQVIDSVFGTGVTVTDTGTANNEWNATADSTALTLAGAEAGERQRVQLVITRTVSDAADDWAADVELGDVVMEYGVTSLSS